MDVRRIRSLHVEGQFNLGRVAGPARSGGAPRRTPSLLGVRSAVGFCLTRMTPPTRLRGRARTRLALAVRRRPESRQTVTINDEMHTVIASPRPDLPALVELPWERSRCLGSRTAR
jgi:hypothetical protein